MTEHPDLSALTAVRPGDSVCICLKQGAESQAAVALSDMVRLDQIRLSSEQGISLELMRNSMAASRKDRMVVFNVASSFDSEMFVRRLGILIESVETGPYVRPSGRIRVYGIRGASTIFGRGTIGPHRPHDIF